MMPIFQPNGSETSLLHFEKFSYHLAFILVLVIAYTIRGPLIFTERLGSDEALYSWYVDSIAENPLKAFSGELTEYHPPLIPSLYAAVKSVFPSQWTLRTCAHIINILEIGLLYLLGLKLKNGFLGLFCAIHLAFNPLNILYGSLIMLDIPLSCLFLLLLYLCTGVKAGTYNNRDWQVGIVASLAVLCKWSGLIVIPFLILFYLALPGPQTLAEKFKKLMVPLGVVLVVTACLLINNAIQIGSILPKVSALTGRDYNPFSLFYFQSFDNIIVFRYLIILIMFGFFAVWKNEGLSRNLLYSFLVMGMLALCLAYVKKYAYILFLIPVFLLFAGYGANWILETVFTYRPFLALSRWIVILSCMAFGFSILPEVQAMIERNNTRVVGFKEAAAWVVRRADSQTTIIAQSHRILRYYSKINFKKYGGSIVPCPRHRRGIEDLILQTDGHIIFVVNLWSADDGFDPFLRGDKENTFLTQNNLRLFQTITRDTYFPRFKRVRMPVIKIYERKDTATAL